MRIGALLSLCLLAVPLVQAQVCPAADQIGNRDALDRITSSSQPAVVSGLTDKIADSPPTSPSAKQSSAAATSSTSPDVLSGADFSSLLALALDGGLGSASASGVTFDLNFFSSIAAMDASVLTDQDKYEHYTTLRRFAGSVTFGGQGDSIDQNGDGKPDPPRTADKLSDIVNWEIRIRLVGTHDRRDKENYAILFGAVKEAVSNTDAAYSGILSLYDREHADEALAGIYCGSHIDAFLKSPEASVYLKRVGAGNAEFLRKREEALKQIDDSLLVTLAFGGTERGAMFGPDRRTISLRASQGAPDASLEGNLDYSKTKAFQTSPDINSTKLALAYKRTIFRGVDHNGQGTDAALSIAWEKYENVPNVAHNDIAKVNLKLVFHVSDAVDIPVSITWANHQDLLTQEEKVRGHIGFTIDTRKLFQTTKAT